MGSFLLQVNDYGTGGFHLNLAVVTINGIQIIAMPHCIIIKESQTYCINLASTVFLFFINCARIIRVKQIVLALFFLHSVKLENNAIAYIARAGG